MQKILVKSCSPFPWSSSQFWRVVFHLETCRKFTKIIKGNIKPVIILYTRIGIISPQTQHFRHRSNKPFITDILDIDQTLHQ